MSPMSVKMETGKIYSQETGQQIFKWETKFFERMLMRINEGSEAELSTLVVCTCAGIFYEDHAITMSRQSNSRFDSLTFHTDLGLFVCFPEDH